jgi:hypothetical protein
MGTGTDRHGEWAQPATEDCAGHHDVDDGVWLLCILPPFCHGLFSTVGRRQARSICPGGNVTSSATARRVYEA